jgi:hypothetical protein
MKGAVQEISCAKAAQGWAKNTELDKSLLIISVEGASKLENKSGKFNVR